MFGIEQLLKHNGTGCPTISIVGDGRLGVCDGARWAFVVKKKSKAPPKRSLDGPPAIVPFPEAPLQIFSPDILKVTVLTAVLAGRAQGGYYAITTWADLLQAKLAIVLSDNPVALAGGVFKFLAVHDLHCTTGVLDDLPLLQNTSCQAHGRSICP
jgi:hypothetical protein